MKGWGYNAGAEYLPSMHEILASVLCTMRTERSRAGDKAQFVKTLARHEDQNFTFRIHGKNNIKNEV